MHALRGALFCHWVCTAADQLPAPLDGQVSFQLPLNPAPAPLLPPCPQTPLFSFQNYVNGESLEGEDVVVWAMIGAQHVPRSEDSPLITNMGALACCDVMCWWSCLEDGDALWFCGGLLSWSGSWYCWLRM